MVRSDVPVNPGDDLQAAVNAHPPGTTFLIKAGRHRRQSVVPKTGNSFIGEPGAILDGENVVPYAFHLGVQPYPNDVRIQRLIIERYAPPPQHGAIMAGQAGRGRRDSAAGWVVEGCEIRNNAAGGIRLGHKMKVLRNNIHHNGQVGISGIGDSVLVEDNEIAYNNDQKTFRSGWVAGGAKFIRTRWLVVRGNYVHHNGGNGLWTDIDNIHTLYEHNRVTDNAAQGIFHEISYDAVIRHNVVERNGFGRGRHPLLYGAGILVAHSVNVDVHGNTVANNYNGIAGIQQRRGSGEYGPRLLQNLYVHDNTITMAQGRTGVADGTGDPAVFTGRNNRFQNNTYHLGPNPKYFTWMNKPQTLMDWQGFTHDVSGRFHRQ